MANLYKQLGVSSKDTVVEVQKGDLVAGYVNQTSIKTAKKIKEARGGILFVDEAYQLTQALQRGQSDFSGGAIDEMMKVMNESGRKACTFVFAGYKKEMDEFVQYNAGLESRIKYRFHFDDYTGAVHRCGPSVGEQPRRRTCDCVACEVEVSARLLTQYYLVVMATWHARLKSVPAD